MKKQELIEWFKGWLALSLYLFFALWGIGLFFILAFTDDPWAFSNGTFFKVVLQFSLLMVGGGVLLGVLAAALTLLPLLLYRRVTSPRLNKREKRKKPPRISQRALLRKLCFLLLIAFSSLFFGFCALTIAVGGSKAVERGDVREAVVTGGIIVVLGMIPSLFIALWAVRRLRREGFEGY